MCRWKPLFCNGMHSSLLGTNRFTPRVKWLKKPCHLIIHVNSPTLRELTWFQSRISHLQWLKFLQHHIQFLLAHCCVQHQQHQKFSSCSGVNHTTYPLKKVSSFSNLWQSSIYYAGLDPFAWALARDAGYSDLTVIIRSSLHGSIPANFITCRAMQGAMIPRFPVSVEYIAHKPHALHRITGPMPWSHWSLSHSDH